MLLQTIEFGNFSYFYNMPLGLMLLYIAFLAYSFLFAIRNKWRVLFFCCMMINIVFTVVAILGNCDLSSAILLCIIDVIMLAILVKENLK
jgi:hypothetical protein